MTWASFNIADMIYNKITLNILKYNNLYTIYLYCNTMTIIILLLIDSSCNILMSVYHTANTNKGFIGGWYPGYHLPCPPPRRGGAWHGKIRENGPGSTKVPVLILSYCQVNPLPFSCVGRSLPGCKVHTQDRSYPWTVWTPQTNLHVIGLRLVAFVPVSMYLKWYTLYNSKY